MLKKSFENIDNRASVPEGIAFRKALYWEKIQKNPSKKPHSYWPWAAAGCILVITFGIWISLGSHGHRAQYILSQVPQESQMDLGMKDMPKPITNNIYFVESSHIKLPEPLPQQKTDTLTGIKSISETPTISPRWALVPSFSLEVPEKEFQEEKPLSPSANALKKALANTKKEGPKEEKMVVEKLTFEQTIQARKNYFLEKNSQKKSKKENE